LALSATHRFPAESIVTAAGPLSPVSDPVIVATGVALPLAPAA
jgi:hypothetical protein